ncbi:MAG: DUF6056 family protein, partial [Anaerolineae bacterium]|nr:DUF6056 family protein [Anaerolineae bacterium]
MIPVNTRLSTYVYFVLLIIFVSALTLVAYTGFFSRYLGDDYCSAEAFNENGLIGSAVNWYMTWEGRYTHTLIRGFIGFVGPRGVSFFPLFLLVLWILALTFLLTEIGKILRMRVIFPGSLVSASIIVFVSLDGVPLAVKIQAFYWAMGSTPYTLPIILIIFNMGLFLALARKNHLKNTPIQVLMTMGITFLASGLSEIAAIFQIAVFMLVLCLCLLFVPRAYRRTAIHLALLNLVCALIGFGFLLAAPGNKVRGASLSPNSLETTLRLAITHFREPILHNT